MSQSEILIGDPLIHGEGWHLGAVQHGERRGNKFNGTGRKLEVLRSCKTGRNRTAHRDHILRAESVRGGGGLRMQLGTEDHLSDSIAVTQINEDHSSMIATGGHPTAQGNGASNIGRAQCAAEAVTVVHGKIERWMKVES